MSMKLWGVIKGLLVQGETDRSKQVALEVDEAQATTGTKTTLKSKQTANRDLELPDAGGELVEKDHTQTLTNKTIGDDLLIQGTTESTDKDTGALVVEGGVGVEKNLNVGGNVVITGDLQVDGNTTSVNTATLDVEDANITVNKNGNQASANAQISGLTVEMSDAVDAVMGYDSTLASRFKAGESGSEEEVITSGHTQTLTNKTIDADNNTISNLAHGAEVDDPSSGVHGVTGNIVGDSDTQTLTNKTIDGDDNTIQDVAITSLKTEAADANKFIERDGSGAVISGKAVPTGDVVGNSDTQTLTNKTIDATDATGTNSVLIDAADASYDNSSSGLTATDAQAAIDELDDAIDNFDAANKTLSNLDPTSINQSLVPDTAQAHNLGSSALPYNQSYTRTLNVTDGASNITANLTSAFSAPSGDAMGSALIGVNDNATGLLTITDGLADADPTPNINIETGNKTAGTGDSGYIKLRTGSSAGGSRGDILIQDGSEGTIGQVLKSKGVNGEVEWDDLPASDGINYVPNADMEVDIAGYNVYNDGAVSEPVDGPGGS